LSTILYQALTNAREVSSANQPPALSTVRTDGTAATEEIPKLLDMVVALVPVEVLAAHALLHGAVSQSTDPGAKGPVMVTITDETSAGLFWVLLIIAAVLFYVVPHWFKKGLDPWDLGRPLVPACAFASWTMLEKSTLFDAVADWDNTLRTGVGVGLALLALLGSKIFADTAQAKQPGATQLAAA
jgi:hypothetical protein